MVKFYASAKFAVGNKIDLMLIFQCGIGVYHKLKVKHKHHQTLCIGFTEIANEKKYRENTHPKFQKKKSFLYEQFLIDWKIIFIVLSELP